MVVLDLPEGFFGGLVKLQFYDVNIVFCLNGNIYAALAGRLLYLHIVAQHGENQVEGVLEILFFISSCHHVASACQHGLDGLQQVIGVAPFDS